MQSRLLSAKGDCLFSYKDGYGDETEGICVDCARNLDRRRIGIQEAAWSGLPSCCMLGDWDQLLAKG